MSITLPPALVLRLGRDLELPIPAALEHLEQRSALLALLAPLEGGPREPPRDWADLGYRMRYIAAAVPLRAAGGSGAYSGGRSRRSRS